MKYNSLFTTDGFPDEKRFGKNIFHMLYKERLAEISKKTAEGEERPPLLLHSCCGPCSSAVITKLAPFFKLTVFYYNPNIDTLDEYMRRAACQKKLLDSIQSGGKNFPHPVSYIEENFDSGPFYEISAGLEEEAEGGARCEECFKLRLDKTAETASQNGFHFFCTTLTVSPMKNARAINLAGKEAAAKTGCEWLWSDFKKENGYILSIELSRKFGLYRQQYCGCIFSKRNIHGKIHE